MAVDAMLGQVAYLLEKYLDVLNLRQKLVVSNIANADTPGYRTRDLAFREALEARLKGLTPRVYEPDDLPTKNDGNNVSLDREARLLAENLVRFRFATELLRVEIEQIRKAISAGRTA